MPKKASQKKKKSDSVEGILIPAGLLIGMGIGFLTDALVAGLFIGLGAGFVAYAAVYLLRKGMK